MKPISSGSPWNGTGSVSCASPTSGVRADTVSSPSANASRSGAFFCASSEMRRTTSVISVRRQRQLVLVGVGQQLAVVGELAVDQPRREHDAAGLEDDLVRAHRDAEASRPRSPARSA